MRIGVIGLGDIAQKAYLPVIANRDDVEIVLCTRNEQVLAELARRYRIRQSCRTVDELVELGIDAAFVHAAIQAHKEILEKLLNRRIHAFVDKPIADSYEDSAEIVRLSEKKGCRLMVGFNRRFAPMYARLQSCREPRIIVMQKNRPKQPGEVRSFIFDDFIHVVDTLRFLLPERVGDMSVEALNLEGKLVHVIVRLRAGDATAIGIMNRDSGMNEETLEMMASGEKRIVRDLTQTVVWENGGERTEKFGDWISVLHRRGFPQMIEHFLNCVRTGVEPTPSPGDSLLTHELCEAIVREI